MLTRSSRASAHGRLASSTGRSTSCRATAACDVELGPVVDSVGSEDLKRHAEPLARFQLRGRVDHGPNVLSGGQRQRVAIARLFENSPSTLHSGRAGGKSRFDHAAGDHPAVQVTFRAKYSVPMVTHDRPFAVVKELDASPLLVLVT